ncbi:MAG: hypothetical protein KC492_08005 [Myxococcales bacterium]|nr:hypothetical protein [Myxococcales bacterium]
MWGKAAFAAVSLVLVLPGCGSSDDASGTSIGGSSAGLGGDAGVGGSAGSTSGGSGAAPTGGAAGAQSGGAGGSAGAGGSGSTGGSAGASGQTLLRVHYRTDTMTHIGLRGEGAGLSWDVSTTLTESSAGVWELGFQDLQSGLQFKPVLEGAAGDVTWPKGASFSNWLLEPGETLDVYPFFLADRGRLESLQINHPDGPRDVVVYLPPSYDEPGAVDKRYRLLILQDGQNLFDENAFFGGWRLQESLDALFAKGQVVSPSAGQVSWEGGSAEELIVAGVFNAGAGRLYEYTPTNASVPGLCDAQVETCGGGAAEYLQFVIDSVAPALRGRYRTASTRMGFGGSSLGGLLSLQACWTHSESFDRCLIHSPSLWWDSEWAVNTLVAGAEPGDPLKLYVDAGTQSDGLDLVRQLNTDLQTHGFTTGANLWCLEGVGMAHNELAWAERAPWGIYFAYADPQRAQPAATLPSSLRACQ